MAYLKTVAGALAIMMASGMIADFDVSERGGTIHVRIWSPDDMAGDDWRLRKQVAALLSHRIDERQVVVVNGLSA